MKRDVKLFVNSCPVCDKFRGRRKTPRNPLHPVRVGARGEILAIDLVGGCWGCWRSCSTNYNCPTSHLNRPPYSTNCSACHSASLRRSRIHYYLHSFYFENQKIQVSKFDYNVLNFWENRAQMVLKTDESEGKILKICIKIKKKLWKV